MNDGLHKPAYQGLGIIRLKVNAALDVLESKGATATDALPVLAKFIIGLCIRENGPTDTLSGLHALLGQLDETFPKVARRLADEAIFPQPEGAD